MRVLPWISGRAGLGGVGQLLKLRCSWAVVPAAPCSFSQKNHFHEVFATYKYGIGPGVSSPHYRVALKNAANASLQLLLGVIFSCSFEIDDPPLKKKKRTKFEHSMREKL